MVKHGSDINMKDAKGKTLISYISNNHPEKQEIKELLRDSGMKGQARCRTAKSVDPNDAKVKRYILVKEVKGEWTPVTNLEDEPHEV